MCNGIKEWIPKSEMEIGATYECCARNFTAGVWNGEGFLHYRTKFNQRFPDVEYHWDDGTPHGTVKPLRKV